MTDKIYLHGINANEKGIYDSYSTIKKVGKILRSRYLLTLKQQRQIFSYGFNGVDYISLCDYEKRDIAKRENRSYNGFKAYAESSVAFAFAATLEKNNASVSGATCVCSNVREIF
jgi:hypothetical protein